MNRKTKHHYALDVLDGILARARKNGVATTG